MSDYQSLKLTLVNLFNLPKSGFHIAFGLVSFLVFSLLIKRLDSFKLLLVPLAVAIILEVLDVRDAIVFQERIDWIDTVTDILITTALPVLVVVVARLKK